MGIIHHPSPKWTGESLENKSLLLLAEQGIGDEMMFASCIPDLLDHSYKSGSCKSIVLTCTARLVPLFSRSFPNITVIDKAQLDQLPNRPGQPTDFHCSMGSLPAIFRNDLQQLSNQKPYLIADADLTGKWRARFSALPEEINIGISWRGGTTVKEKSSRSIALSKWTQILSQRANFVSVQYGQHDDEISTFTQETGITIHQWEDSDPLLDLDDFAAQISALDLVISIDNSTIHMAGSLGVETWTLLPFNAEWRWLLNRSDSPWYPSIRLFRQQRGDDWDEVRKKVDSSLEKFLLLKNTD